MVLVTRLKDAVCIVLGGRFLRRFPQGWGEINGDEAILWAFRSFRCATHLTPLQAMACAKVQALVMYVVEIDWLTYLPFRPTNLFHDEVVVDADDLDDIDEDALFQ
uniref:Uncharacterized protein n=1 Tax=Cyclophora tenuis TaxID=216820 RepID=A0A6U1S4J1_CYCTE|mmetsp:Transcript_4877/g.8472  ORF Transcript_4877/g.8472 Transcript_4877/m.8472 type:complete len:106 (+) Transcript_4877:660-977(+)|eukprot:CAMPEP_0116554224 /NCGR_PEP_ID=MMETSP0397-20121206/7478_1 /TAXON_ID=216820 /ORGANISM="Cyclophora tenuis, Strain ECT3854" /LENGTH=105 /DNA_ID=CAMNT_0004079371 /DNA_START=1176 /DNA_END=1493 /DNA_ORIENTATION=-